MHVSCGRSLVQVNGGYPNKEENAGKQAARIVVCTYPIVTETPVDTSFFQSFKVVTEFGVKSSGD